GGARGVVRSAGGARQGAGTRGARTWVFPRGARPPADPGRIAKARLTAIGVTGKFRIIGNGPRGGDSFPDFGGGLAMKGLTTALVSRACRIFLTLAYPQGMNTVPPAKAAYLHLDNNQALETVLAPPVCQPLLGAAGHLRGYALRLGSVQYPHLKMQVIDCDHPGTWVFAVDTHDGLRLDPGHADAQRWALLQAANRRLKEQI